tara:strand:+ start:41937 stop:43319 length:1383 start_codon:yes stop_codon:yes gene_type:complete
MKLIKFLCAVWLLPGLAACASIYDPVPQSIERLPQLSAIIESRTEQTDADTPVSPNDVTDASAEVVVLPDPHTAQLWALGNSPAIREIIAELEIADADYWQQTLLRNPGFELGLMQPESGGRWRLTAGINLSIIDLLSRARRTDLTEAEHFLWQQQALVRLNEYMTNVRHDWLRAVADSQKELIFQTIEDASSVAADMARLLLQAGNISELDKLAHESAAARQQINLRNARIQTTRSMNQLRTTLGLNPDLRLALPSQLPDWQASQDTPSADEYLAMAEQYQPALQLIQRQLQRQTASLAEIEQRVTLMRSGLTLETERESDGQHYQGLSLSLAAPLFDRGQAELGAERAQTGALQAQASQVRLATYNQIDSALQQQSLARQTLQQLQEEDLPRHELMLNLALREYNFMLSGSFDLLRIREQSLQSRLAYVDTLASFWRARADLSSATGTELLIQESVND